MDHQDYVLDDNGCWGTPGEALAWYRQQFAIMQAALEEISTLPTPAQDAESNCLAYEALRKVKLASTRRK